MGCNCKKSPCTEKPTCTCATKDLSTDCVLYTGEDLSCSGITSNTLLTKAIEALDVFICNKFEEVTNYLTLTNIGGGAEVYKGISGIGNKEIRTIITGDDTLLDVVQDEDTISITSGTPSLSLDSGTDILSLIVTTLAGATTFSNIDLSEYNYDTFVQSASFNSGTLDLTIVRNNGEPDIVVPLAFLDNHVESVDYDSGTRTLSLTLTDTTVLSVILPSSSEIISGLIEIATQAEVDSGVDTSRAVTPATLSTYVSNYVTTYTSNPVNLPNATETARGIAEIATQAEVDAGIDDERFITPAKLNISLSTLVENYLSTININPIRNTGTITSIDPGFGTINSFYTVSGDIVSAQLEDVSGQSARILVTMANAMDNTSYVVKSFHESLGDINLDDNVLVSTFKTVSATQFRISLSDPLGGVQTIRLHLDIEQR